MRLSSLEKALNASRNFVGIGLIVGLTAFSGCSAGKHFNSLYNSVARARTEKRKVREKVSENLRLNRNNDVSLVTYKCFDGALEDIGKMNEQTSMEEAFLGVENDGNWTWYEIGKKSSSQGVDIKEDYFLEKLKASQDAEKFYVVHNHSKSPLGDERYPSRADWKYLFKTQNLLDKKIPKAEVEGLVHSGNNITNYSFTEKGLENYTSSESGNSEKIFEMESSENFRSYIDKLKKEGYVNLEFRPYQEN